MYHTGDRYISHNIYLKFYEDSDTGSQYFMKKSTFSDRLFAEGEEVIGDGVKVAFQIAHVTEIDQSKGVKITKYKKLDVFGDDEGSIRLLKDYFVIEKGLKLD